MSGVRCIRPTVQIGQRATRTSARIRVTIWTAIDRPKEVQSNRVNGRESLASPLAKRSGNGKLEGVMIGTPTNRILQRGGRSRGIRHKSR